MDRFKRKILVAIALAPAALLILGTILFVLQYYQILIHVPGGFPPATLIVAIMTLLVSTVSAASTIWLAWSSERRQRVEFRLKIEQLELQLAEARKKGAQPDDATG